MGILNKEALGCALEKFSESFYKVYLINLTKDSYEVIKVSDENKKSDETGKNETSAKEISTHKMDVASA